jgi:hypothetical protein
LPVPGTAAPLRSTDGVVGHHVKIAHPCDNRPNRSFTQPAA